MSKVMREGLWFLSLITSLCGKANVQWEESEELFHPKTTINYNMISKMGGYEVPSQPTNVGTNSLSALP